MPHGEQIGMELCRECRGLHYRPYKLSFYTAPMRDGYTAYTGGGVGLIATAAQTAP
jgi:hypothetical protein